jgi:hypothetical protein
MTMLFALPAADGFFAVGGALFAAGWFDVAVPIVVFVIWIINQIISMKKAGGPPAGRMPPRPQQPAGQGAGQQPGGQRGLMDEVEQFLREARRAVEQQQQGRPNPPVPSTPQARTPQQQQRPPQKQKQKQPKSKQAQQPKGRVPLAEQSNLRTKLEQRDRDDVERGSSVDEHVRQHLDTSRFAERAGRLSHLQQQVEHDIGEHVHGALDHQVGRLAETPAGAAPDAAPNVANQIAAMLGDPASLRNAVILQEILAPPAHRW